MQLGQPYSDSVQSAKLTLKMALPAITKIVNKCNILHCFSPVEAQFNQK
jgi:hypothetical protein